MRVRFGFVAMSGSLQDASPSHTVTATRFLALPDRQAALDRLGRLTAQNLASTLRILRHAVDIGVEVYRFSSRIVPLLGHPATRNWDFVAPAREDFARVGAFVRAHDLRVSVHPEHFTLLNSHRPEVVASSRLALDLHCVMLDAMGLGTEARLVVHPGGLHGGREASLDRFAHAFASLEDGIRTRLVLENDDRTFTAVETLGLANRLGIPMVLDVHHHRVNPGGADPPLAALAAAVWKTWPEPGPPPKVHLSSPRSATEPRPHADRVAVADVLPFLNAAASVGRDVDAMLEAKDTDRALGALMADLSAMEGVQVLGGAAIAYGPRP